MPQSNSNLQSYAKLPAAKNNSPKIPQISQNISLRLSLMPHTDLTDPSFARLTLNLTEALRTLAPLGSHRSHSKFAPRIGEAQ